MRVRSVTERKQSRQRALTDEQKREVLDRIYAAWTADDGIRLQRLGQLIENAVHRCCEGRQLFHVEDSDLVTAIDRFCLGATCQLCGCDIRGYYRDDAEYFGLVCGRCAAW